MNMLRIDKVRPTFIASIICLLFAITWTSPNAKATPCSCWDSGTSVYMGAKCHAAWEDMYTMFNACKEDPTVCKWEQGVTLGLFDLLMGMQAMEACHKLCNLTQEKGVSGYTGNEWWYADQTAYNSCINQNPNVLKNWPKTSRSKKK